MKRVVSILLWAVLGLLLVLVLVAGVTQTQFFRDRLRAAALSTLDSLLIADVELGEVTGNLVTGFSIAPISVSVDSTPVITADRLDLRYDLFQIPGGTISVDLISLIRPRVTLRRTRTGAWNIDTIVRPTPDDTTLSGPFDWSVVVKSLELHDGTVRLLDSVALEDPEHGPPADRHVEYHRFTLEHLSLRTSFLYTPTELRASIRSLSFVNPGPGPDLDSLSGDFRITPSAASVRRLTLATGRSRLSLDASIGEINLLEGLSLESMQNTPAEVSLRGAAIDLGEFGTLLPPVDFLNGRVNLDLEAKGTFGELAITRLNVRVGGSSLWLTGDLFNLHTPDQLLLDVQITSREVSMDDARALLPTMDLPAFPALGPAAVMIDFEGSPLDFTSRIEAETRAGTVRSTAHLAIGGPASLVYESETSFDRLNPSPLLADPSLAGSLNGRLSINGRGVSLAHLDAALTLALDSSTIVGQRIEPSTLTVRVSDRDLSGDVDLKVGSMHSALTARVNDIDLPSSAFAVRGTVERLNLEDFLRDPAYSSDLTMTVDVRGTGMGWADLTGEFNLAVITSRFADYRIQEGTIRLAIDQRDPSQKSIRMESNVADFELRGAFDVEYLARLIEYEAHSIRLSVGERFASLDPTLATGTDRAMVEELGRALERRSASIDASYLLTLKDLVPLSRATGNRTFNGVGTLRGSVQGDYHNLSMDGRLSLRDFFYGSADSGVLIQNVDCSFQVTDLQPGDPLKQLEVFILGNAARMHLNRSRFDSLALTFKYTQEYSSYNAHARFNRDLEAGVRGIAAVSPDELLFTLNGFRVAYRDYVWTGEGGASFGFSARGLHVDHVVARRDSQVLMIDGGLGSGGVVTADIRGTNLDLAGLRYVFDEGRRDDAGSFSGLGSAALQLRGSLQSPEFEATAEIARFAFRGVPFGAIAGSFRYRDQALLTTVTARQRQRGGGEIPILDIRGTLPLRFSLAHVDTMLPLPPLDLAIRSDGAQMSILDPLVPTFNQLSGVLRCDVELRGSLEDPRISGDIEVDSCSFLFVPNNISYNFRGRFQPSGDRIRVTEAELRNIPADLRAGRVGAVTIAGDFALHQLLPTDFNFTMIGTLLVVKETTRKSSLSVYGNLFIETGPAGLKYTGTIEHSLVKGAVLVKNSTLVFPPTLSSSTRETERTVRVVVMDDTSTSVVEEDLSVLSEYFGTTPGAGEGTPAGERGGGVSLMDGLRYDLQIESRGGNTEIRMVFNPTTGEELVANLEGKFSILDDGTRWVGPVTVDRAFYNFTKRFAAKGTITYTGDFLNPELDITAEYAGTRTLKDSVSGSVRENIVVILRITGTRFEPKLDISMTIDGREYATYTGPKSSDVNSDAIQFLITGTFPLTQSEKNDIAADLRNTVGTSLVTGATSLLSSTLSEFLRSETGFINSIEFGYGAQGSLGESADIRISGVLGDGLWRVGGKVLGDPLNNANVGLLYSLGDVFSSPSLRNFMFELERKIETPVGQLNDRKEVNSVRLFYRLSF